MTSQVLPADDDFNYPTEHYGANVCLYLGCAVTTAGSPHTFQQGRMHGGYQVTGGTGIDETPCAVANNASETTTENDPRGFMFRDEMQEDVIVTATIRARSLAGSLNYLHLAPRGIMARVQAGTLTDDDTTFVRYEDVTCYMATVYVDGSANLVFSLDRVNTGTVTNLENTTLGAVAALTLDINQPVAFTLDVQQSAGDADITAKFEGFSAQATITLTHTDSSGSKVTGAGRCGFHMGRDREFGGGVTQVIDLCESFGVKEVGVGQTLVDTFVRYQPSAALAIGTDQFGNSGDSLQMAYTWDQFTHASGSVRMLRDTAAQRAKFVFSASDSTDARALISARPATSRFSQHRRLKTQVSAQPGVNVIWIGVCTRASQPIPIDGVLPLFNGYAAVCVARSAAVTVFWEVHRIVNGITLLLAQFDDTGSTYWPGYATDFTLALDCYPQKEAIEDDAVTLKMYVDGVQIPLVKNTAVSSGLSGVLVDASGTITDGNVNRIPPSFGEGIVTFNGVNATPTVGIEDWTELTLTNEELPDRDQASVSLGDEGTASATFTVIEPGRPMEIRLEHYSILSPPMDSGHRRSIPRFTDSSDNAISRRLYRFRRQGVTKAELDSLITFFNAREGAEEVFNWTPARESSARKVHLVGGSFRHVKDDFGTYSVDFSLGTNV